MKLRIGNAAELEDGGAGRQGDFQIAEIEKIFQKSTLIFVHIPNRRQVDSLLLIHEIYRLFYSYNAQIGNNDHRQMMHEEDEEKSVYVVNENRSGRQNYQMKKSRGKNIRNHTEINGKENDKRENDKKNKELGKKNSPMFTAESQNMFLMRLSPEVTVFVGFDGG